MKENVAFTETVANEPLILDPHDVMGSARRLAKDQFTIGDLRTLHRHRGTFWVWTGSHYRFIDDEAVRAEVWKFLDRAHIADAKNNLKPFRPKPENISAVSDALKALCRLDDAIEPPTWLSGNGPPADELFACGNGLLHLPTARLLEPTPAFFGLTASEVKFNPKAAKPKRWAKFLNDVIGDKRAILTLQEMFGYTLTPDTSQQKLFMLLGQPRSGKGTTARVHTELLGRESVTGPSISTLSREFGLQSLISCPLAIIPDARVGQKTDKATVVERLLSISGEDTQNVPRKHLPDWNGRLRVRFMILTNELLALADGAGALAKRFIVIMFPHTFLGRENPNLTNELLVELSGILNWAVRGYRRLRKRGHFIQPPNAEYLIEEIEALGAPIKSFVRDCCVVDGKASVDVDRIFNAYRSWCEKKGQRASNQNWFARELRSAVPGLRDGRPRVKGTPKEKDIREHLYYGVKLKGDGEPM